MSQNYESFGKYILLEKLAAGGMAEVFLARSPSAGGIGRFVAIKKMLPQFSDNPDYIQMFKEEAKIALNLTHSNIVSIYEFGIFQGQLFLVMDYVSGRNLRQILNKMKSSNLTFTEDQVAYMLKEVAAGLDHAHRCLSTETGKPLNITHRDISPQNIMISFEGEVKIVDFGIAKAENQIENTRTGTLKGKFGYMSPEQVEGHPLDLRTDIFSTGIVIWETLASERLFLANNEINTLKKIRDCQIPSLTKMNPNISPELERIVQKALARDRNLRYQTAAALHRDLNRFLNRQYPDFSSHDFSVFVKTLYTDEILDIRKKLVQYSRIGLGQVNQDDDDKTIVTGTDSHALTGTATLTSTNDFDGKTITQTATATGNLGKNGFNESDSLDLSVSKGLSDVSPEALNDDDTQSHSNNHIIDERALQQAFKPKEPVAEQREKTQTIRLAQSSNSLKATKKHKIHGVSDKTSKKAASADFGHTKTRRQTVKKDSSFNLFNLVLLMTLLIGVYFVFEPVINENGKVILTNDFPFNQNGKATNNSVGPGEAITPPPAQTENTNAANKRILQNEVSNEKVFVINSRPSGADIILNGRVTGKTTPDRISVANDKLFDLSLKKEGYILYRQNNINPRELDRSFTATLQKAMIGLLDIDVIPPQNIVVFVNGKRVGQKILPIYGYAVPAKTPVTIKAVNTVTQATITKRVTLNVDEKKRITLKINNNRRRPSHRRK